MGAQPEDGALSSSGGALARCGVKSFKKRFCLLHAAKPEMFAAEDLNDEFDFFLECCSAGSQLSAGVIHRTVKMQARTFRLSMFGPLSFVSDEELYLDFELAHCALYAQQRSNGMIVRITHKAQLDRKEDIHQVGSILKLSCNCRDCCERATVAASVDRHIPTNELLTRPSKVADGDGGG